MLTSNPDIMMLDMLMDGLETVGGPRRIHTMRCADYIRKEPGG